MNRTTMSTRIRALASGALLLLLAIALTPTILAPIPLAAQEPQAAPAVEHRYTDFTIATPAAFKPF